MHKAFFGVEFFRYEFLGPQFWEISIFSSAFSSFVIAFALSLWVRAISCKVTFFIAIEAGLSFLGLGAQPPMPSWGGMIKDHYTYIIMDKAYLAIIPGVAIMSLVLAFMLLGNGLRDAFDVKN